MVVDVENMSDAEIRTKLMEFGFPVMPITGTTRKLMVKKLKMLLDNKGSSKGSGDRRSLGRYSSEEESDSDAKAIQNKEKNRRATMAAPSLNRSITRSSRQENNVDVSKHVSPPLPSLVHTTSKRTTTSKIVKSVQDEFDTGSDSEPEVIEVEDSPVNNYSGSSKYKNESSRYGLQQPISYSTPKSDMTSSITTTYSSNISNRPSTPPRFSTFTSPSTNDAALDRLNQIRSRLSLGNTGYERASTYKSPVTESKDEVETPFLSNFTRRLSQLSAGSPKQEYGFKNDIIKEHDTNGATDYSRSYALGRSKYRDVNRDYYPRHDSNIVKNNLISFAVLGVALMFFVVVGAMYWGMRSSDSALETSGKKFN